MPALLLTYAANMLLMPGACQHRLAATGGSLVSCVAAGSLRLFAIAVVLPLLATRMLESRARATYAALRCSYHPQ